MSKGYDEDIVKAVMGEFLELLYTNGSAALQDFTAPKLTNDCRVEAIKMAEKYGYIEGVTHLPSGAVILGNAKITRAGKGYLESECGIHIE